MPIRLVCPSCSATLSVKDEYTGRAVKCPKCASVIPASPSAAAAAPPAAAVPPPPPPPAPELEAPAPAPFEALDEPAKPKPKITGRPTGKPVAKSAPDDEKPARRKDRDESDERTNERSAKKGSRESDDDDRPARGKRKHGDDEDDRPAKKKGGGGVMIATIICGSLLLCCGGSGFGVYWFIIKPVKEKVEDTVQKVKEDLDKRDSKIEVTAEELARAFAADERAANTMYRGKTIVVSGALLVSMEIAGQRSVSLTGGVNGVIKPGFDKGVGSALRGQTVRVKGRCEEGDKRNVILSDCEVLEVVPVTFVTVTADAFFADFAKNPDQAEQKYTGDAFKGGKYLHVTDARVTKVGNNELSLAGQTTKGSTIQLRVKYRDNDAQQFAEVKIGDRISVKGQSYVVWPLKQEVMIDWATIAP